MRSMIGYTELKGIYKRLSISAEESTYHTSDNSQSVMLLKYKSADTGKVTTERLPSESNRDSLNSSVPFFEKV